MNNTGNGNSQVGTKYSGNGLFKSSIYGNDGTTSTTNYQKPSFLNEKSTLNHSGGKTATTSGG